MRQDKTTLIFQAAIDIFSERGFEKATMDDIAARANVAKGTIYYHFKSKEELFLFLVEEGTDLLQETVNESIQPEMKGIEKVETAIRRQTRFFAEYSDLCIILLREAWGAEDRQKEFRKMLVNYTNTLQEFIKQAIQEGDLADQDAETAAWTVFGGVAIPTIHYLLGKKPFDVDELASQFISSLLTGLANPRH